jgi:hypothetical protein
MGVKKFKDRPDSMTDLKGYRKYYYDRGLCPRCREHRELAPGHKNCRVCLDKLKIVDAKRYRRYRAERRCTYCGKPLPEGADGCYCPDCRQKALARYRGKYRQRVNNRYDYRVMTGRCVICSRVLDPEKERKKDGSLYKACFACRQHKSEILFAWREKHPRGETNGTDGI